MTLEDIMKEINSFDDVKEFMNKYRSNIDWVKVNKPEELKIGFVRKEGTELEERIILRIARLKRATERAFYLKMNFKI